MNVFEVFLYYDMIKAIIFDLDNTLVDFAALKEKAIEAGVSHMLEAGLQAEAQEVVERVFQIYAEKGWEYQHVFNDVITEFNGEMDYKYLAAGITGYRQGRAGSLKPYPGVHKTLIALIKRGIRLGLVSDAPGREAWLRLYQIQFHHLFDVVVTYSDSGEYKPAPKPFNMALEKLGVKAKDAMMVGDWAERDMVGGKNLGMKTVFVRYGDLFDTGETGADYEINKMTEILDIVDGLT